MKSTIRLACVVLLIGAFGCAPKQTPTQKSSYQPAVLPDIDSEPSGNESGISDEQALTFAQAWRSAIVDENIAVGRQSIAIEKVLDRVVQGLSMTAKVERDFRKGFMNGSPVASLIGQIHSEIKKGGSYQLVRVVRRAGTPHAIFRLLSADGALNYHDMRLYDEAGKLRCDQIFVALSGESFADTIRSVTAAGVASSQSVISRLSGEAQRELESLEKVREFLIAVRSGDPRSLELFAGLPEDAKQQKAIQLNRIVALSTSADEDRYLAALDEYESMFPNDASLALVSFDAAVMREDSDKVNRCCDALEKWTGGDAYFSVLVASALQQFGDTESAKQRYAGIDRDQIDLPTAHDYALGFTLGTNNHAATLYHLRALRDDFQIVLPDLGQEPDFAEFVKSPEYATWKSETE